MANVDNLVVSDIINKVIICFNGCRYKITAGKGSYSTPSTDNSIYTHVEVGVIEDNNKIRTIYGYQTIEKVLSLISGAKGIVAITNNIADYV